jgi:signal transduction histidine kinase
LPLQDCIAITVTDNGEGISPENMTKLFQPLFTTKARGFGLGLVVCKNLVEANGGQIEVESEVGKGTTFTVVLPTERDKT